MSEVLDRQTNARRGDVAVPVTAAQFMLLFDRLLTGGALYPARHVNFTIASENFRAALSATGGTGFTATEAGEYLRVGSEVLGQEIRGVERVAGIMEKLGLHRIEILPGAREEDLHQLATSLLGNKREADTNGHLARADFGDLPETIRVMPREFAKQWAEVGATGIGEAMDAILNELTASGAAEAHLQSCRATLAELFEILMPKDLDTLLDALDPATRPQDAVGSSLLAGGAHDLADILHRLVGSGSGLSKLMNAMRDAVDNHGADIDRSAARALLKAMGEHDAAGPEASPAADPRDLADDTEYSLPLADLRCELAAFDAAAGDLTVRAGWEDFFICLAVLQQGSLATGTAQALAEVTRFVKDCDAPENEPHLQQAVSSLLTADDPTSVDRVIEIIATVIRARGPEATLTFWERVCATPRPGLSDAVWPHLVCELLTAPDGGRELMLILPGLVGSPRAMSRPGNLARLEKLKAFGDPRGGVAFFRWPERRCFPVYAALLKTSRSMTYGTSLQAGLAGAGPDPQIRALAEALGPYRPNQSGLYRAWLRTASTQGDAPPPELLEILRNRLATLAPAERSESWVAEAVTTIGQHSCAASRQLLRRIVSERRLLVIPAWPLDAREAAERTLGSIGVTDRERREDFR